MALNKEKLSETLIPILVIGLLGSLIFAILYVQVFVLDHSERVFQKSVLSQYEEKMKEKNIRKFEIRRSGAVSCRLRVWIDIDGIKVQNSMNLGGLSSPYICSTGFTDVYDHPQLFGSPLYRAEVSPELFGAEEDAFDLNAYKSMMSRSKVMFTHVFELSDQIKAEFDGIKNNIY